MLAKQIRTAIEQLRGKLDEVAAFTATQRELLDAEARVAQLRAKLADLAHADGPQPAGDGESKRPAAARPPAPPVAAAPANGQDIRYSTAVREWARSRGMQVAPNGRIADTIIAAYRAAH
jgi:hypothetical protein